MNDLNMTSQLIFLKEHIDIYVSRCAILTNDAEKIFIGHNLECEDSYLIEISKKIIRNEEVKNLKLCNKTFIISDLKDENIFCYEGKLNGFCVCVGRKYIVFVSSHDYQKGKSVFSSAK
ncbi:hypothetical protein HZS_6035, partial [Henneguya salminicola]